MQGVVGGCGGRLLGSLLCFSCRGGGCGPINPGRAGARRWERQRGEEGTCGGETGEVWNGPGQPLSRCGQLALQGRHWETELLSMTREEEEGVPAGRAIMVYLAQSPHFIEGETEAWRGAATAQGHTRVSV